MSSLVFSLLLIFLKLVVAVWSGLSLLDLAKYGPDSSSAWGRFVVFIEKPLPPKVPGAPHSGL